MLLPAVSRPPRRGLSPLVTIAASACFLSTMGVIAALALAPRQTHVHVTLQPAPIPAAIPAPTVVPIRVPAARFAQPPPPLAEPAITWASHVRGMSSQYDTDAWAATQALGAPDVYPASGDQSLAWASAGEDDRTEYLDLGFSPHRMSAVRIYETFNPGAVSRVELTFADGTSRVVDGVAPGGAGADAVIRRVDLGGCTAQDVIAVRLTIDSKRVAGWNEIDAVGGETCP